MRRSGKQGRWGDLPKRMASALIMLAIGAIEVWLGGVTFAWLVIILTGLMLWELARMQRPVVPWAPVALGLIGSLALYTVLVTSTVYLLPLILVPTAACTFAMGHRKVSMVYALAIMLAGYTLVDLRAAAGTPVIIWLISIVVASDVMGYFVGRSLGGPKFWPRVSPNKTWSGTIAGWVGAAIVGAIFVVFQHEPWELILLSPVVAFAGQLGDIAESWIKRRAEIKDSSSLIPGHGGVLDRFDALIGAVVAILLLGLLFPLPIPNGI
ncbi:phosphatidate cytidylyltransferase [Falsirhodobacter halotolerans]|uniref:phosphatidate cytidylyltransferase n=1 Tax=Falsirhodobacter halotolerans TaxID=1146892 RepID=UPI001FD4612A|nr:phosphatidate cytidylyltransferase [Falsirhodobacter halotolerans]MCJ8139648.1 phosphatidate cytidylyltransferase [Falsirhodobacter halotolerans]